MSASVMTRVSPAREEGTHRDPSVFELIRAWQTFLESSGTASPRTCASHRYALLRFLADTLLDLREVDEPAILEHFGKLDPRGSTRGDQLRALKSFYRWATERRIVPEDPARRLKITRRTNGRAPHLTPEELGRLLAAAAAREPRRRWALMFVYGTGARVGSACEVRPEDVRDGRVYFRVAKNDRPYDVPLEGVAAEAARELERLARSRAVRSTTPYADRLIGVGPERFRQWVAQAGADSGVRAWPHLLRHTFATRVYEATKDPMLVAELLNHADLSQIRRYVAVDEDAKRVALQGLGQNL